VLRLCGGPGTAARAEIEASESQARRAGDKRRPLRSERKWGRELGRATAWG
jgi:hypothetical protein